MVVGFDWLVLSRWFGLLSQDVRIGQFSVSFADILTGLLVLLIVNMVTRQMTALLDGRLLQRAHLGAGERASITTLINYIGMAVAVLLALGIIGVGWTQLAIIAGALSVGIGFGLQGIVNNFVSGLILLFERPIKVGDWVVVSSGQGYVRSIGAGATEIETFDRSSVLVPNAELVTGAVENWFYKRRRGRIRVKVGVSYKSDPEQVCKILLDCAAQLGNVVNYPFLRGDTTGGSRAAAGSTLRLNPRITDQLRHSPIPTSMRLGFYWPAGRNWAENKGKPGAAE